MTNLLVAQLFYAFKQDNNAMEIPRMCFISMVMTHDSTCTHGYSHSR